MTLRHRIVRLHRATLVVATTVLAIGGSRVATDPSSLPDWLLTLSGALGMYLADEAREADDTVRQLPPGKGDVRSRAIADILETKARWLPYGLGAAIVLALAALWATAVR
jgi:hypothetical protein